MGGEHNDLSLHTLDIEFIAVGIFTVFLDNGGGETKERQRRVYLLLAFSSFQRTRFTSSEKRASFAGPTRYHSCILLRSLLFRTKRSSQR